MKTWNNPVVEEINVKETAGGGVNSRVHDGVWKQDEEGQWWEGTESDSNGFSA